MYMLNKVNHKLRIYAILFNLALFLYLCLFLLISKDTYGKDYNSDKRKKQIMLNLDPKERDFVDKYREWLTDKKLSMLSFDKEDLEKEQEGYKIFKKRLEAFQDKIRKFSTVQIESPFNAMLAVSTAEDCFTAKANGRAEITNHRINVLQVAEPDIVVSNTFKKTDVLPAAQFKIKVGEKDYDVNFEGGDYAKLYQAIRKAASNVVYAEGIEPNDTEVFIKIKALNPGNKNKISLSGNVDFLKKLGFIVQRFKDDNYPIDSMNLKLSDGLDKNLINFNYTLMDNNLVLLPKKKINIQLIRPLLVTKSTKLIIEAQIINPQEVKPALSEKDPKERGTASAYGSEKSIGNMEATEIGDYVLYPENPLFFNMNDMISRLSGVNPEATQKVAISLNILQDDAILKTILLSPISQKGNTFQFQLVSEIPNYETVVINKLNFVNEEEKWAFKITKIEFTSNPEDKVVNNDVTNYKTQAKDAVLIVDGEKIVSNSNIVDKAISNVTINLHKPTLKEELLKIDRDYKTIIDSVSELFDEYNFTLMFLINGSEYVNKKRSKEERDKEKAAFYELSDSEKTYQKLSGEFFKGIFNGEFSIRKVVRDLKEVRANKYETVAGDSIAFLKDIGVKLANSGGTSVDLDSLKKGFVEFDKEEFKQKLVSNYEAVKDMFAKDSDHDLKPDKGVSINLYKIVKDCLGPSTDSKFQALIPGSEERLKQKIKFVNEKLAKAQDSLDKDLEKVVNDMMKMKRAQETSEKYMKQLESQLGSLNKKD